MGQPNWGDYFFNATSDGSGGLGETYVTTFQVDCGSEPFTINGHSDFTVAQG
jgi:hypothetical protein